MNQLKPGDVIAFKFKDKYYYAIILTKIIMFGGNLVYAFHLSTDKVLKLEELLALDVKGFNVIVDFIFVKRENRIIKLGKIANYSSFRLFNFFKSTNDHTNKVNKLWFIEDENFKEVRRTSKLTAEEKRYPPGVRFVDESLVEKINNKWLPEQDEIGL